VRVNILSELEGTERNHPDTEVRDESVYSQSAGVASPVGASFS
jgi:hypothetical protein